MSKFVGAKLPDKLYEALQKYKKRNAIESDSEAVRDILRKFLLNKEVIINGQA
jgi:metal-responsive CopG/Arc/MetJ family transcriptional regulator